MQMPHILRRISESRSLQALYNMSCLVSAIIETLVSSFPTSARQFLFNTVTIKTTTYFLFDSMLLQGLRAMYVFLPTPSLAELYIRLLKEPTLLDTVFRFLLFYIITLTTNPIFANLINLLIAERMLKKPLFPLFDDI